MYFLLQSRGVQTRQGLAAFYSCRILISNMHNAIILIPALTGETCEAEQGALNTFYPMIPPPPQKKSGTMKAFE